ncbi:MAG: hypothetical protein WD737_01845 [Gemmatimonadota bacterium]
MMPDQRRYASLLLIAVAVAPGCEASAPAADTAAAEASELVADAPSVPEAAASEPTLDDVRAATERFQDVNVALAEGYIRDPADMCVTAEMEGRSPDEGAMGVHYFRPDLLGITGPPDPRVDGMGTYTDFSAPAVLVYEPQADGSMELVGVENLVFVRAWEEAGNLDPPSYQGIAYDRMEDDPATEVDEAHGFEAHYDRHVWLYRENPLGVFAPMNPDVTCDYHAPQMAM